MLWFKNSNFVPESEHGPYEGQEVVLCVAKTESTKRFRLVFGSRSEGESVSDTVMTVGYAPSDVDAQLRGAVRKLDADQTCGDNKKCRRYRLQVDALVQIAREVIKLRDAVADDLVRTHGYVEIDTCTGANDRGAPILMRDCDKPVPLGEAINRLLEKHRLTDVIWLDDSWHLIERKDDKKISIKEPALGKEIDPEVLQYLNARLEVINALQNAIDGYRRLAALSHRLRSETMGRAVFRLGHFEDNKLIVATLEEYDIKVRFSDDKRRLVYQPQLVPHPFNLTVRPVSRFELSLGVAATTVADPDYRLRPDAEADEAGAATVTETSDGRSIDPVVFASLLWCEQDLAVAASHRRCREDNGVSVWWPKLALGLPISSDLGAGSLYLGLDWPPIPYARLILGLHGSRVNVLDGVSVGDSIVATEVPTRTELKAGAFASIAVSEEVFRAIFSRDLEPAQ